MKKQVNLFFISLAGLLITNCVAYNKTQQIYDNYKKIFEDKINSFIGKTPNELYAVYGKPNEYTTDISTDKMVKGGNIIYEKVYNFHLKQYDCLITFVTNETQTKIISVKYSSDKCYYLSQY